MASRRAAQADRRPVWTVAGSSTPEALIEQYRWHDRMVEAALRQGVCVTDVVFSTGAERIG